MRTQVFQTLIAGLFAWCCAILPAVAATGDCIAIEFMADGCKECGAMHATTEAAIRDGWVVRRIDTKREPHIALRWQIQSVPTTILVRNGREVDRILGVVPYSDMRKRLEAASSIDMLRLDSRDSMGSSADAPIVRGQSPNNMLAMASNRRQGANESFNSFDLPSLSAPVATATPSNPQEATVRIRVEEPNQEAVGTGTIIDSHQGEALVLTCGHLFRDSGGQAKITIETFINGQTQIYQGTLIDFQAKEKDIGLVSFRPSGPIPTAKLISVRRKLAEGQRVFSVGCDRGANPTRIDSKVTKLNRYLGPANVEVAGQPVEGRSGGGLFDEHGELIGVCYAADPSLNEGLYNAPEVVYEQLAKLGLQRLFHQDVLNESSRTSAASDNTPRVSMTPEVTVSIRDREGRQEQLTISNPSPQLLQALRDNAR